MGTEQNRAGQNRTEQNRTEQNRTEGRGKARRLCSSRRGSWEDGGVLWREGRGRVYYGCMRGGYQSTTDDETDDTPVESSTGVRNTAPNVLFSSLLTTLMSSAPTAGEEGSNGGGTVDDTSTEATAQHHPHPTTACCGTGAVVI